MRMKFTKNLQTDTTNVTQNHTEGAEEEHLEEEKNH